MLSKKTEKILQTISKNSQRPTENPKLLGEYLDESFNSGQKITFFDWECPPRILDRSDKGQEFVNYCVDLPLVFKGEKIDQYTEIPKVVKNCRPEKQNLKLLQQLGIQFRFVKLIADTNIYYLTPEVLDILGKRLVEKRLNNFKDLIKKETAQYPTNVEVYLFTELIKNYQQIYDDSFNYILNELQENNGNILPTKYLEQQFTRTKKHVGLSDNKVIEDFSLKTIATYVAEGIIFNYLAKESYFSNCVWLNTEEVNPRTIELTNCLRKKQEIGDLPMVFL